LGQELSSTALLALWSPLVGFFLCAVYDFFRIFRLRKKQNGIILFFNDLFFCLIATVTFLLLFFNLTYGRVRVFAVILALGGFALWRITVSALVIRLCLRIAALSERLSGYLKNYIKSKSKRLYLRMYTAVYCHQTVKESKKGFVKGRKK